MTAIDRVRRERGLEEEARALFLERLAQRAATLDELLSDAFEAEPGSKEDAGAAAERLAEWCRSSASGDWSLFFRRLRRDGWTVEYILPRLARVRRMPGIPLPNWVGDADWIERASRDTVHEGALNRLRPAGVAQPFEHLLAPIICAAEVRLRSRLQAGAGASFAPSAVAELAQALVRDLTDLCAAPLYEQFLHQRQQWQTPPAGPRSRDYNRFVDEMRAEGWERLFEDRPVLLRLIAVLVGQWLETTAELVGRLETDRQALESQLRVPEGSRVVRIETALSDRHNRGRSVAILHFEGGTSVVYKPKDLQLDACWRKLLERLSSLDAPCDLRAPKVVAREGYGWTEFVEMAECADTASVARYFTRAGAWLCLLHLFAATDMHEENIIAAGEHPVPIDLEMLLQAAEGDETVVEPDTHAVELAGIKIAESVIMTGLLPDYIRSEENKVVDRGGLNVPQSESSELLWRNVNTDEMVPERAARTKPATNVPRVGAEAAKLVDYLPNLIGGFESYGRFILELKTSGIADELTDAFAGLPTRVIERPTRFYGLLLERLKNPRWMGDGAAWSANADFITRVADWDQESDPLWPLVVAEREALLNLNIPFFIAPTDGQDVGTSKQVLTKSRLQNGLQHARDRIAAFDAGELAWQAEVIRLTTSTLKSADEMHRPRFANPPDKVDPIEIALTPAALLGRAGQMAQHFSDLAVRSGPGAAWIGLDWLGDSSFCRLVVLGPDFYNGAPGVSLFLSAYARLSGDVGTKQLALAGLSTMRHNLRSPNSARYARALGLGAGTGLGSVVYGLSCIARVSGETELLEDGLRAARLFTDEVIAADRLLDVLGGAAGGILGLLALYEATGAPDVLARAVRCGDHLLAQPRGGTNRQSWAGLGVGAIPPTGMSHGAAGFAVALSRLAEATGRADFADAARACLAFEDECYSPARRNWPTFDSITGEPEPSWPCQWCHGAAGIGLARVAMLRCAVVDAEALRRDIDLAVAGVRDTPPPDVATLCCGACGSIEFLKAASGALSRDDLRIAASGQLAGLTTDADRRGDYVWNVGDQRFSLGLFRGLAGVGYTLLREVDPALPNVLAWD